MYNFINKCITIRADVIFKYKYMHVQLDRVYINYFLNNLVDYCIYLSNFKRKYVRKIYLKKDKMVAAKSRNFRTF